MAGLYTSSRHEAYICTMLGTHGGIQFALRAVILVVHVWHWKLPEILPNMGECRSSSSLDVLSVPSDYAYVAVIINWYTPRQQTIPKQSIIHLNNCQLLTCCELVAARPKKCAAVCVIYAFIYAGPKVTCLLQRCSCGRSWGFSYRHLLLHRSSGVSWHFSSTPICQFACDRNLLQASRDGMRWVMLPTLTAVVPDGVSSNI